MNMNKTFKLCLISIVAFLLTACTDEFDTEDENKVATEIAQKHIDSINQASIGEIYKKDVIRNCSKDTLNKIIKKENINPSILRKSNVDKFSEEIINKLVYPCIKDLNKKNNISSYKIISSETYMSGYQLITDVVIEGNFTNRLIVPSEIRSMKMELRKEKGRDWQIYDSPFSYYLRKGTMPYYIR